MSQRRILAFGLILALLALVMQPAANSVVPRIDAVAALNDATEICHVRGTPDQTPPAPHSPPDCLVCPLCVSLSPTVAIPVHAVLPAPRTLVVARAVAPPPAAPPSATVPAERSRDPPTTLA